MKRYRLSGLADVREGHVLQGLVPGRFLYMGAVGFKEPGEVTHPGRHSHDDEEVFVILQGKGAIEISGHRHRVGTGDVIVVEPGEDHHLISSQEDPLVNLWLHAGPDPHAGGRA